MKNYKYVVKKEVFLFLVLVLMISLVFGDEWNIIANPGERSTGAVIIDSVNQRMVLFGGDNAALQWGTIFNDVWALTLDSTNTVWKRIYPQGTPPSGRRWHSAIYDAPRRRMIIFGGNWGQTYTNEVWCLHLLANSATWQQLFPTGTPPSPRSYISAIYDAQNQRMIIFAGSDGTNHYNDVWSLNLNTLNWQQIVPSGTPPNARGAYTAIYDQNNNRTLVFGGRDAYNFYNDVWALSLSPGTETWTHLYPSGTPPNARAGHIVGYDPIHNKMLIFGGYFYDGGMYIWEDVWSLNLTTLSWSQLQPTGEMPIGRRHCMGIFDYFNNRLIIYGGYLYADYYLCDTRALKISNVAIEEPERFTFIPETSQLLNTNSPTRLPVTIAYNLNRPSRTQIKIFNAVGKYIKTVYDGAQTVGIHRIIWDGKDDQGKSVGTGVFYCQLDNNGKISKKKFILVQ